MGEQSILKYHHFNRYFTYSMAQNGTYSSTSSRKDRVRSVRSVLKTNSDGEFGWGGTSVKRYHRCPKGSSERTETFRRVKGQKLS